MDNIIARGVKSCGVDTSVVRLSKCALDADVERCEFLLQQGCN
jgi:hypothetical protein